MHGEPTPEVTVAEFRAHYLLSGNAAKSARKVGIPVRTGQEIATRLSKDPTFAQERADLRARYLDELVAMRMQMARLAVTRASKKQADEYPTGQGSTVIDKRPEWAKVVLDAEKNAHALAKAEREPGGEGDAPQAPAKVTINVHGPASVKSGD